MWPVSFYADTPTLPENHGKSGAPGKDKIIEPYVKIVGPYGKTAPKADKRIYGSVL